MEDNILLSEEMQEVAEPVEDITETVRAEEESEEIQEVADPVENKEENRKTDTDAAFADLRRKWQTSEGEKKATQQQLDRAKDILAKFGFNGATLDDVFDAADANLTGQDVTSVRQERIARQEEISRQESLAREVEYYRRQDAERRMREDLKAIQKIDPQVKNINELGEDYFKLIRAGLDGVTAFTAIRAKEGLNKKETPPEIGRVNSRSTEGKDYFTDKELDTLSGRDLDDPDVFAKAMKSLTRKKK